MVAHLNMSLVAHDDPCRVEMVPPGAIALDSLAKVFIVLAGGVQIVTDYVRRHATTSQSANDIPFHAGIYLPLYSSTHAKGQPLCATKTRDLDPSSYLPNSFSRHWCENSLGRRTIFMVLGWPGQGHESLG